METEPEHQLAGPSATWQEHWFDHRQLLRLNFLLLDEPILILGTSLTLIVALSSALLAT